MTETAIKALAEALDRFTDAYDRRTEGDARRLAFEERRELRIAEQAKRRGTGKRRGKARDDSDAHST